MTRAFDSGDPFCTHTGRIKTLCRCDSCTALRARTGMRGRPAPGREHSEAVGRRFAVRWVPGSGLRVPPARRSLFPTGGERVTVLFRGDLVQAEWDGEVLSFPRMMVDFAEVWLEVVEPRRTFRLVERW